MHISMHGAVVRLLAGWHSCCAFCMCMSQYMYARTLVIIAPIKLDLLWLMTASVPCQARTCLCYRNAS